ncbi:MAG: hypothetical protein ACLTXI_05410, partial [Collinsella sp.]
MGTDLNECLATWQLGTFLSCRQLGTVLASTAGEPAKTVPDDYSCTLRASAKLTRLMERVCS